MPNPYHAPEISVQEVARKRAAGESFVLMDVRELAELSLANLGDDAILVSMSELAARQLAALPEAAQDQTAEIVVFCHTGVRSAQVTAWLRYQGWQNVTSMAGGIDAYAAEIDPGIGFY
ncbi:MAG: rhodanese-like domain-containing protein [Chloroflexota bacterium]